MTSGLTRARILELFEELDGELHAQGVVGELYLVGGAVMCLAFDERRATKVIDGFFVPKKRVRTAARKVGESNGLDEGWLNDAVKGFLSSKGKYDSFLDLDHLKIFVAQPQYMLAMKCLAMRLGPEFHDERDVRFLLRYLNIDRYEQAIAIITRYYPEDRFPQKTLYALMEMLEDGE